MLSWLIHRILLARPRHSLPETPPLGDREAPLPRSSEILNLAHAADACGRFDLDLVTGQVRGTPPFFALLGLPAPYALFTREEWFATIHPQDLEAVIQALNTAIAARGAFHVEYRSLQLDGMPRCLACRGRVIEDAQGYAGRALGAVSDATTARKR